MPVNTAEQTTPQTTTTREKGTFPFKLGADPEFLLFYAQQKMGSSAVFDELIKPKIPEGNTEWGNIGPDGNAIEIRPKASNNPLTLTENIGHILQKIHETVPYVDITTLSIGNPIGGHIHLEIPQNQQENQYELHPESNQADKLRAERLLGTFQLPILASEHRISAASRAQSSYGNINDYRTDEKENNIYTVEMRAPTPEWTLSKDIAYATLCYFGVVWHEILKRSKELQKETIAARNQSQLHALHGLIITDYQLAVQDLHKKIHKLIQTFELYQEFKPQIDFICNPTKVAALKEKLGWNINQGWQLDRTTKTLNKRTILAEKTTSTILKKENQENNVRAFMITYNDDLNVQYFAQSLSERIVAHKWGIKKEYFAFGIKKDYNDYLVVAYDPSKNAQHEIIQMPSNMTPEALQTSIERMGEKYFSNQRRTAEKINPRTGHNKEQDKCFLIGIPYSDRVDKNTKTFLSKIWDLEHNKYKKTTLDEAKKTCEKNAKNKNNSKIAKEHKEAEQINSAINTALMTASANISIAEDPTENPEAFYQNRGQN